MYRQEVNYSRIIAIIAGIFTVISILITFNYTYMIMDAFEYVFSDPSKVSEILEKCLHGIIIWVIISLVSGFIARLTWEFSKI